MRSIAHNVKRGIFCAMALVLGACTTVQQPTRQAETLPNDVTSAKSGHTLKTVDKAILSNLTPIITQIFNPIDTTIQVNRSDSDPALKHLVQLLTNEGFGIQRVSADQGANYLSYTRSENTLDQSTLVRFTINIGAVSIERDYNVLRQNRLAPASKTMLSGTRAAVAVDESPSSYIIVTDPSLSATQYVASFSLDEQSPVISLITPEVVGKISAASAEKSASVRGLNASQVEVNNLFYESDSTFSSLLDDYQRVSRQIIVFGNDSMLLGSANKSLIDQFVNKQVQPDDLINLIGCSNGRTALSIGNKGLALGRAKRVTEALLTRGIARANVLDEGCWAPVQASDRFPSRAVVLELWRKQS